MRKISSKIIVSIVISCILLSVIISSLFTLKSQSLIREEAEQKLIKMAQCDTQDYNKYIDEAEITANSISCMMASTLDLGKGMKDATYMDQYIKSIEYGIKNAAKGTHGIVSIVVEFDPKLFGGQMPQLWCADTTGNKEYTIQKKLSPNLYTEPDEKGCWYNPCFSDSMNMEVESYVAPIKVNGKLVGMVETDISFDKLKNSINSIKTYNRGYGFLMDQHCNILIHKSIKPEQNFVKVNKDPKLKAMENEIKKNDNGKISYTDNNGKKKILGFAKYKNSDVLCIEVEEKEMFEAINNFNILIVVVVAISLAIISFIALYMGKRISKPISKTTSFINKVSQLDLSYDNELEKYKNYRDESGVMIRSTIKLISVLREVIDELKGNSGTLLDTSSGFSNLSNDMVKFIDAVSSSIDDLASASEEQAAQSQESVHTLENLAGEINNLVLVADGVKDYSEGTIKVANDGVISIENLIKKFDRAVEIGEKTVIGVEALEEKSKNIEKITNVIDSIASQTSLLSLNASIEAARAGEAGKGFAVVANEISNLSQRTSEATKEIDNIINSIQNEIITTKENIDLEGTALKEASISVEDSKGSFRDITNVVSTITGKIEEIVLSIKEIDANKNMVLESVNQISDACEETSTSIQEVAAGIEQQKSNTEIVENTSKRLNNVVSKLNDITNKFKI